jgi:hypothetical protein
MDMLKPVERIIRLCGGLTALSRALGHRYPTTVQHWKESGLVPSKHIPDVIVAAKTLGVVLTPDDFFDPAPELTNADTLATHAEKLSQ